MGNSLGWEGEGWRFGVGGGEGGALASLLSRACLFSIIICRGRGGGGEGGRGEVRREGGHCAVFHQTCNTHTNMYSNSCFIFVNYGEPHIHIDVYMYICMHAFILVCIHLMYMHV